MSKKEKNKKPTRKRWSPKRGSEVFFTAFLKKDKNEFFVCKGTVKQVPEKDERQVYKVRITAVGDRPVGGQLIVKQAALLGRIITKRVQELTRELNAFMQPPNWIEWAPKEKQELIQKDQDGVIDTGGSNH